jgi:hypothetical protein
MKKMKRQTKDWEKIFADHITGSTIVSRKLKRTLKHK